MIQHPKQIYNNETGTSVIVQNQEQEDALKGYFKDPYDNKRNPYPVILLEDALQMNGDAVVAVEKEVKKDKKEELIENLEEVDPKTLSWTQLKFYVKDYVEPTFGVNIPLRATRGIIEKKIEEARNGDNKRPNKASVS